MLQHYALGDHITFDAIASALPYWYLMDNVIFSWLFDTLIVDLSEIIRKHNSST
jgi:hypothetical protein